MTSSARLEGYTLADWDSLEPTEGRRVELHHGKFVVSAAPRPQHQRIGDRLRTVLDNAVEPVGLEALTAIGVRLDHETAYIPDIVVTRPVDNEITSVGARDVPLVVEIVSPSSRQMDRLEKPAAYASAGVPRYWRVELDKYEAPTLIAHTLSGDVYSETTVVLPDKPQTLPVTNREQVEISVDYLDRRR